MSESRLVECRECGHRWESTASDPRCSDPNDECGRARADPVHETDSNGSTDGSTSGTDGTDTRTDSTDSGTDGDADGWSPIFETSEERTGAGGSTSAPSIETDGDDDDQDGDDGGSGPDHDLPELEAEDVRPFLVTIFGGPPTSDDDPIPGYASQQKGEHWQLKDHELENLSRAYARVGNKYLPYLLAEYTVEGLALLTTATIVAPRLQEDRRRAEREKKRARDTGSGAADVRSETSGSGSRGSDDDADPVEDQLDQLAQADGDADGWAAGANV